MTPMRNRIKNKNEIENRIEKIVSQFQSGLNSSESFQTYKANREFLATNVSHTTTLRSAEFSAFEIINCYEYFTAKLVKYCRQKFKATIKIPQLIDLLSHEIDDHISKIKLDVAVNATMNSDETVVATLKVIFKYLEIWKNFALDFRSDTDSELALSTNCEALLNIAIEELSKNRDFIVKTPLKDTSISWTTLATALFLPEEMGLHRFRLNKQYFLDEFLFSALGEAANRRKELQTNPIYLKQISMRLKSRYEFRKKPKQKKSSKKRN